MFKKIFYKATVLTVIAVSACSCNKYLTLRPQNGITADNFWLTKEQLQGAVIGIYNSMETGPTADFFLFGEIRADFVVAGPGVTSDEQNIINTAILPSNGIVKWASFYAVINLCNNVIQSGPGVLAKDATLTQTQLNAYLGEALAIRSLMYFYLVRSYRDVPLKLTPTATDDDLQQLAKTDSQTILKQIVSDLATAESYAPASYADVPSDKGRINKFTINSIQADVYLWMDDYADCITACNKVINSGKYGLVAGPNMFTQVYAQGNSAEGIFELQFDAQQLNPFYNFFSPLLSNPQFKADPNLIDNYYTQDPVNVLNYDYRGLDVAIHVADQTIYKYEALSPTTLRTTTTSYAHWIFYRYADILLMKAEADINSSNGAEALSLINVIRTRANALPTSAPANIPDPTDVYGLTTYLVNERAREFAFEGKRWYDLLRNAKRNNFARLDLLASAATESVPALYKQSAQSKLRDPNYLYFPIPTTDLQTDPNLVQNPFYK